MDVISEMMGVPEEDRAEVRRQADIVVHREDGVYDVPPAGAEASLWLVVYYQEMVDQRRRRPTDDLTSALIEAEVDGERLSDEDVIAFLFLMVVAGNETTTKLLGHALFHLTRHPEQLAQVFGASRTPSWSTRGSRRPSATTRPASCWLATCCATSSCTGRSRRRAPSCCSASARPTATSGSSAVPTTTTSPATRTSSTRSCPSAAAGTSASAPTWPGSRPASR